jgi:hypothetical protein
MNRRFTNVEELEELIEKYFERCDAGRTTQAISNGKVVTMTTPIPYTVEGLAVALGIERRTLLEYVKEYKDEPEILHTIKRAKERVLGQMSEKALMGESNSTFSIFLMKCNFKYDDKVTSEESEQGDKTERERILEENLKRAKDAQQKSTNDDDQD